METNRRKIVSHLSLGSSLSLFLSLAPLRPPALPRSDELSGILSLLEAEGPVGESQKKVGMSRGYLRRNQTVTSTACFLSFFLLARSLIARQTEPLCHGMNQDNAPLPWPGPSPSAVAVPFLFQVSPPLSLSPLSPSPPAVFPSHSAETGAGCPRRLDKCAGGPVVSCLLLLSLKS